MATLTSLVWGRYAKQTESVSVVTSLCRWRLAAAPAAGSPLAELLDEQVHQRRHEQQRPAVLGDELPDCGQQEDRRRIEKAWREWIRSIDTDWSQQWACCYVFDEIAAAN